MLFCVERLVSKLRIYWWSSHVETLCLQWPNGPQYITKIHGMDWYIYIFWNCRLSSSAIYWQVCIDSIASILNPEETLTPRENLMFAAAFILPKLDKEKRSMVVEGTLGGWQPRKQSTKNLMKSHITIYYYVYIYILLYTTTHIILLDFLQEDGPHLLHYILV